MIELRPRTQPVDAPLVLPVRARPALDASVRPLCRGIALATALSLPAFGPIVADRLAVRQPPEVVRATVAPLFPPSGGAAVRVALLREGAR